MALARSSSLLCVPLTLPLALFWVFQSLFINRFFGLGPSPLPTPGALPSRLVDGCSTLKYHFFQEACFDRTALLQQRLIITICLLKALPPELESREYFSSVLLAPGAWHTEDAVSVQQTSNGEKHEQERGSQNSWGSEKGRLMGRSCYCGAV